MNLLTVVLFIIVLDVTSTHNDHDCLCGIENSRPRIIGGTVVEPLRYPWMVGIITLKTNGRVAFCGGSIINSRFLLTAAHCVHGLPLSNINVVIGAHTVEDLTSFPLTQLADVLTAGFKNSSVKHDFALLKLAKPLNFSDHDSPSPICLSDLPGPYSNSFVSGWGLTNSPSNNGTLSKVLNEVALQPLPDLFCRIYWRSGEYRGSRQLCAGQHMLSACQGDSGGPLASRYYGRVYQIGIVSFGDSECGVGTNKPTVFTKISTYKPIISAIVDYSDIVDGVKTKWCK